MPERHTDVHQYQIKMRVLPYTAFALYVFTDLPGSDVRQTFFALRLSNALLSHCRCLIPLVCPRFKSRMIQYLSLSPLMFTIYISTYSIHVPFLPIWPYAVCH